MAQMSREKGKRGEREAAKAIEEALGVSARRGVQYQGGTDSPDIVTGLPGVHFEVKRREALKLYPAMAQAIMDAGYGEVPVVLHRKNRFGWLAVVPLVSLRHLAERITEVCRNGNQDQAVP